MKWREGAGPADNASLSMGRAGTNVRSGGAKGVPSHPSAPPASFRLWTFTANCFPLSPCPLFSGAPLALSSIILAPGHLASHPSPPPRRSPFLIMPLCSTAYRLRAPLLPWEAPILRPCLCNQLVTYRRFDLKDGPLLMSPHVPCLFVTKT